MRGLKIFSHLPALHHPKITGNYFSCSILIYREDKHVVVTSENERERAWNFPIFRRVMGWAV
jgi:hypothetical protein